MDDIQLLVRELTDINLDTYSANTLALGTLIVAGILTSFLNIRDTRRGRQEPRKDAA